MARSSKERGKSVPQSLGILLGTSALALLLPGCGQDINPFTGEPRRTASQRAGEYVILATSTAAAEYRRTGEFVRPGWAISTDGLILLGVADTATTVVELKATLAPDAVADGRVTNGELELVRCIYGVGARLADGTFDGKFATSNLTRLDGGWQELVIKNDIGTMAPPSICEAVVEALPNPDR